MVGIAAFLKAEPTQAWLSQIDAADQPIAIELLRALKLVSRDAFAERLQGLVLARLAAGDEPVGLYAERELKRRKGIPFRLFKEHRRKGCRAHGVGPKPVEPTQAYDADVGSEGIIAQLVSELCREQPTRFFNHPGPDTIRKEKIRRFILVTDFIGSGLRAETYLKAAWRVRSVRSWWSARKKKGLRFEVVAYAGTPRGQARVKRHRSRPKVFVVTACPTIDTAFGYPAQTQVRQLCMKYSPVPPSKSPPLGFDNSGALIAFAHGVPNNAPLILHKKSEVWAPLFPARVTSSSRKAFSDDITAPDAVRDHLIKMRQQRLAAAKWVEIAKPHARNTLLVLAALGRPPRTLEPLSRKTGLTISEVEAALAAALSHGWIDGMNRLTDEGHAELEQARRTSAVEPLSVQPPLHYYPKSLRAPRGTSS